MEEIEIYIDITESKIPNKKRIKKQGQAYQEIEMEDREDEYII